MGSTTLVWVEFSHLEITDAHGAESLLHCAPVTNEVLIADRGYAKAKALRAAWIGPARIRVTSSSGPAGGR